MTRSEVARNVWSMRKYRDQATASPEAARQALQKAGILTRDGEIADHYRILFSSEDRKCIDESQVSFSGFM